jgi:hypothetical protein
VTDRGDRGSALLGLLSDGSLVLDVDPRLMPLVRPWIPLLAHSCPEPPAGAGVIRVRGTIRGNPGAADGPPKARATEPGEARTLLRIGRVVAWHPRPSSARPGPAPGVRFRAPSGVSGRVAPGTRGAVMHVHLPTEDGGADGGAAVLDRERALDLHHALTLASALVLAARGRALLHASAVEDPAGGGWVLAGDARSGKSTTAANLRKIGWALLSDDQVVLGPGRRVEGWLRPLHLDRGWARGRSTGVRVAVEPEQMDGGPLRRQGLLRGILLPSVAATGTTRLEAVTPGEALSALVRQSPWLLSDHARAAAVMPVLSGIAAGGARRLLLGADVYRNARPLEALLAAMARNPPTGGAPLPLSG